MMEFEDQHDAEEDEELDEEDEEIEQQEGLKIELPAANYDSSLPNSSSRPFKMPTTTEPNSPPSPPPLPLSLSFPAGKKPPSAPARYRECLKNHAVTIGGHAVDGCGEFMPAGPDGSLDALKCAACSCHRNFHRKEVEHYPNINNNSSNNNQPGGGQPIHHHPISYFPHPHPQQHPIFQFYPYGRTSPQQRPLALPSPGSGGGRSGGGDGDEAEMISDPMSAMGLGGTSSSGKKRFRTKFTAPQKEKMMELAEKLEWRLQKQDEAVIAQFCEETGVKRHVLKVWMHNNKHTLGKRSTTNPTI